MIARYLKLWLKYILLYFEKIMAYKFHFIASTAAALIFDFTAVLATILVYLNTKGFAGWTFEEFLLLQGTFIFVFSIAHTSFFMLPSEVSDGVRTGQLDKYITKPVNLLAHLTMDSFDKDGILPMFGGLALVVYSLVKLGAQISLFQLLGYFALIFLGLILFYSIAVSVSSIAFMSVKGTSAIAEILYSFEGFSKYPLPVFGNVIAFIMTFILPYGIVAFYPSTVLLNKVVSFWPIIGASLSTLFIFAFSLVLWSKLFKKYQSAGG